MHTPIRILVADDSDAMRHAICTLLQAQAGITVCGEAGSYAELLKIFNATTTDVVLMDVLMPDGKLFTPATIKAQHPEGCTFGYRGRQLRLTGLILKHHN